MQDKEREEIKVNATFAPNPQSAIDLTLIFSDEAEEKIFLTESNALILCQKLIDFLFPKYFGKEKK